MFVRYHGRAGSIVRSEYKLFIQSETKTFRTLVDRPFHSLR